MAHTLARALARSPALWRPPPSPASPIAAAATEAAAAAATASLAASLVGSFPAAKARHAGAAAAAVALTHTPWHACTVGQLLVHKAGRACPGADRELQQRAGVVELRVGDTVAQAAALMLATGVGSVLVSEGPVLAGIVTLLDVVRGVLLPRRDPAAVPLREVMATQVTCATEAYTLDQCMGTLESGRARHVPVYRDLSGGAVASQRFDEDPRLIGVVSLTDMTFFMAQYLAEHDSLGRAPVRTLLPPPAAHPARLPQVGEDSSCADALAVLGQTGRGLAVVMRPTGTATPPEPVAVLTERSVLRHALAAGPYYADALVRALPTDPLPRVTPDLPLAQLAALQAASALNHVPVVELDTTTGRLVLRHVLSTAELLHHVRTHADGHKDAVA
jgi:CBS domain-containing protein